MDELLHQFVIEATELTQQAADDLLMLEREPGSRANIESAFRAVHTLKGSVGLFDLGPMHTALHAAEDVLSAANRPGAELDSSRIDPLMEIIEWTDRCVQQLAATGVLGPSSQIEAADLVLALAKGRGATHDAPAEAPAPVPSWAMPLFQASSAAQAVAIRYVPRADCFFSGDDPVAVMASVPSLVLARIELGEPLPEPAQIDPFRCNLVFEALSVAPLKEIETIFRLIPDQVTLVIRPLEGAPRAVGSTPGGEEPRRTIRVEVERVDRLVDTANELFAVKNAMSRLADQARALSGGQALARAIGATQQDLVRVAYQIQQAATGVRMVQLNETLRRLPRLVREISSQTGKPVDLQMEGGELEADKSIVDGLFDPLLHVLRNAIDHGVEADRQVAGKPLRGRIAVRARQIGYRIELAISDDGRGIDLEKVRDLAVTRGLMDQQTAEALSTDAVHDLIFRSGFSTAAAVTGLSGRGVGMDAVRDAMQRLGGRVGIDSALGQGTTVTMSLPTSFAVTQVMIVGAAGETYGLPMEAVSETKRIDAEAIIPVRAGEAFILRDRTLPVVRLARLLGTPEKVRGEELLLVTEVAGSSIGLVIDSIGERFETVLRPPAGLLKSIPGISGTTVHDDGRVVTVLDLEALIR